MIRIYWCACLVIVLLLSACGNQPGSQTAATPAPNDPVQSEATSTPGTMTASAIVVPARASELGFTLSAPVKELLVSEGDTVRAGQTLVVLDTPELGYAVIGAEADLRSAQSFAQLQRFRRTVLNHAGKTLYLTGPHEVLDVADSKVEQAQAALEVAQASLAETTLLAPFNGTVVSVNTAVGEYIETGQVVLSLADLSFFQVETTDLTERDVPLVRVGQSATLRIEALNAQFTGRVKQIAPRAEFVEGEVNYKVIIELDQQPEGLRWGMSAEVSIPTE